MRKEERNLIRELERQGATIVKSNHVKVYRGGLLVAVFPSTPSEYRARKNTIAQLRRAGFDV